MVLPSLVGVKAAHEVKPMKGGIVQPSYSDLYVASGLRDLEDILLFIEGALQPDDLLDLSGVERGWRLGEDHIRCGSDKTDRPDNCR